MRIILDTDKMTITVPWNYALKLKEMNAIIQQGGGTKVYKFDTYLQEKWDECMKDTDKHLIVGTKPVKKKD